MPFLELDVSGWQPLLDEPKGKAGKLWLVDNDDRRWLFKPVNFHHQGDTLLARGDDWSERLAAEIAHLLGIPAARVELARLGDRLGIVSADVTEGTADLTMGNEVLQDVNPGYPAAQGGEVRGYTVEAIFDALVSWAVGTLPGASPPHSATAVFAGYLVFDALIGNTDRHHENWALLAKSEGPCVLAPSYDHATSLGFQLSDPDRTVRCSSKDENQSPEGYARKGRSRPFEGRPTLSSSPWKRLVHNRTRS